MAVRLYMNHNVVRAVSQGLQLRGVDVLTALEDGGVGYTWTAPPIR